MPVVLLRPEDTGVKQNPPTFRVMLRRGQHTKAGPAWGPEEEASTLVPLRLTWGHSGAWSTLTLKSEIGQGPERTIRIRPENPIVDAKEGDEVILVQDILGEKIERFRGIIGQESILIQANPDVEARTLTAYGPEARIAAIPVYGQWHKTTAVDDKYIAETATSTDLTEDNVWTSALPAIFNQDGKPNMSPLESRTGSDWSWSLHDVAGCQVFEASDRKVQADGSAANAVTAAYWTADKAFNSLIGWYDVGKLLNRESATIAYAALPSTRLPSNMALEGATLLEALAAVCKAVGYGFRIDMARDKEDENYHIHVFPLHAKVANAPKPKMADVSAGNISIASEAGQKALVQRLDFMHDSHNVRNQAVVRGDVQRIQVALYYRPVTGSLTSDLSPMWANASTSMDNYDDDGVVENVPSSSIDDACSTAWLDRHCANGEDYLAYYNTLRSFVWNEDGAFNGSMGLSAPDLSDLLGANYIRRPRPMGHTHIYMADADGRKPAYVEVGIVKADNTSDDNSWIPLSECAVMTDRTGFHVDVARLDLFKPWESYANEEEPMATYAAETFGTLLYNTLKNTASSLRIQFRLVGAIESDTGISRSKARQSGSAWPLVSTAVAYKPETFKWQSVSLTGNPSAESTDSREDTTQANDHAEDLRDMGEDSMGHGSLVLRQIVDAWRPGDAIASTEGREIPFAINAGGEQQDDTKYFPIIHQVVWNMEEGVNKTELALDSALLKVNP